MKLLVVTDHRYFRGADGIYDNSCFDRQFFNDYRACFEKVRVAARIRQDSIPEGARRCDGDGVEFVELQDVQGRKWAIARRRTYCGTLDEAVTWSDAVCVRIPSSSGFHAYRLAKRLGRPIMFELIGDPFESLQGPQMPLSARVFGLYTAAMVRRITRAATVGSYVSYRHLQRRYPTRNGVATAPISSIRMKATEVLPPKTYADNPTPLRSVLTASLVPVKAHSVLIRAVANAHHRGADLTLDLLGGGPMRAQLEQLVRKLGMGDRITFHGHVADRAILEKLLHKADLFAMTSVSEGMPRAMIEAMAKGVPCVGTTAGGIGELLTPAQRVPVGDWRALGKLIAAVATNPQMLTAFAAHGHTMALNFVDTELSQRRQRLLKILADAATSECPLPQ